MLDVHQMQLNKEKDWEMKVMKTRDVFTMQLTTANPVDFNRMRGLGYIGAMALGENHQIHR